MTELYIVPESTEARLAAVEAWVQVLTIEGKVGPISQELMAAALTDLGANFENLDEEGKQSLSHYSNKGKHLGMEQVWGQKRQEFRDWCDEWVGDYEQRTGTILPKIVFTDEDSGAKRPSKTEGMRQFFGEITAYSVGILEFSDFRARLEARLHNFGRSGKITTDEGGRIKIVVPGYNLDEKTHKEIPFAPASFPPDFPVAAWEKMSSWRK